MKISTGLNLLGLIASLMVNGAKAENHSFALESEELRAQITADKHATLSAEMTGKILALYVHEGMKVERGQKLVQFKCDADNARLEKARIEVKIAENKLVGAKRMAKMDAIGSVELENSRLEVQKANSEVALLTAIVANCTVNAPYAGTISDKFVNENELIEPGKPLLEIQNNQSLRVEFIAPSSWLEWLAIGYPLSIFVADTQKTYKATISYTTGKVDALSQSIKVFAKLDSIHPELLPGMSGKINIAPPAQQLDNSK